jgi:hypothetical protein
MDWSYAVLHIAAVTATGDVGVNVTREGVVAMGRYVAVIDSLLAKASRR